MTEPITPLVERRLVAEQARQILGDHAPYATRHEGIAVLQCPRCIDGAGAGEFTDVPAWVDHAFAMLLRAGLTVRRLTPSEARDLEVAGDVDERMRARAVDLDSETLL